VIDAAVAATCTETGLTEGKHCSVCNEVLVAQTVVDKLKHNYEAVVTAPTCTANGYTTYTCTACGDTYNSDYTDVVAHEFEWVIEGDYKTGKCENCSEATGKLLASNATASFAIEDYLWYNGWFDFNGESDSVWVTDVNGNKPNDVMAVHATADNKIFVVRKIYSPEITSSFELILWVKTGDETVQSEVFTIDFQAYADQLEEAGHAHSTLASVMVNYGAASKVYFENSKAKVDSVLEFNKIVVKDVEDVIPDVIPLTQTVSYTEYGNAYIKTASASIFFDECLSLGVKFNVVGSIDGTVKKIGLLVGDDLGTVLTIGNQTDAYILYGSKVDDNGINNKPGVADISAQGSNGWTETLPNLNEKMTCAFDLDSLEYTKRFAVRPFIIVEKDGDEHIMYGAQYSYGLEDYVARQYEKTGSNAFKNLLVETWHYALEAKRTFSENKEN